MASVGRKACKCHSLHMGQKSSEGKLALSISCDQCSLNIQHHMGLVVPIWTSWSSRQFCLFLLNKAGGRQERDRTSLLISVYFHLKEQKKFNENARFCNHGQVAALQRPFQEALQSTICIFRRGIVYNSVSVTLLLQDQAVLLENKNWARIYCHDKHPHNCCKHMLKIMPCYRLLWLRGQ